MRNVPRPLETEGRLGGEGNGDGQLVGLGFFEGGGDKSVLELDSDDGCTVLWMY